MAKNKEMTVLHLKIRSLWWSRDSKAFANQCLLSLMILNVYNISSFDKNVTLKIPAMDKVRLDVQDTSRNSEKLSPNASRPPLHRVKSEYRKGESSVSRNRRSEELRLRPAHRTQAGEPLGTSAPQPPPPHPDAPGAAKRAAAGTSGFGYRS